jgi:hypothetical protein
VAFAGKSAGDDGSETATATNGDKQMVLICCTIDLDKHICEFWQLVPSLNCSSGTPALVWERTSSQAYDLPQQAIGRAMSPIVCVHGSAAVGIRFGPSSTIPTAVMRARFLPLSSLRVVNSSMSSSTPGDVDVEGGSAGRAKLSISEQSVAEPVRQANSDACGRRNSTISLSASNLDADELDLRACGWGELGEEREPTDGEKQREAMSWEIFLLSGKLGDMCSMSSA